MTRFHIAAALTVLAGAAAAQSDTERGEYLVRGIMGCGNCHTPMGPQGPEMDKELGGRLVEEIEQFTAYAPNITPAGRVSEWSDEELGRAIREGLRPDGTLIGPPMPFSAYRLISDDDLAAIVAFLRTVPAVENEVPKSTYNIPLPPAYGEPVSDVTAPPQGVSVEYGEYLALGLAHCMECHSTMTPMGPDYENGLGRGGFEFHGPWGTSVAANLTNGPDGLADYTDDEIKTMITKGQRPDGETMNPPMPYAHFAMMTPEDLDAIVMYLRSLPALPDAD